MAPPLRVAFARKNYYDYVGVELDISDHKKAADAILKFDAELKRVRGYNVNLSDGTSVASDMERLKTAFPDPQDRWDYANDIAWVFSQIVNNIQKSTGLSREDIIRGYTDSKGLKWYGETAIFNAVLKWFATQQKYREQNSDANTMYAAHVEIIKRMLVNWKALTTLARIILRDTEGVKIGNESEYVAKAEDIEFSDDDLSTQYDVEEDGTRDSYQKVKEQVSAFGSLSMQVRRLLANTVVVDSFGNEAKDKLGFNRRMRPFETHQRLMRLLRSCLSEQQMMSCLEGKGWAASIYKALQSDSRLRTAFFCDMRKAFQVYSEEHEFRTNDGEGNYVPQREMKIKNTAEDSRFNKHIAKVKAGTKERTRVYDEQGRLTEINLGLYFDFEIAQLFTNFTHKWGKLVKEGPDGGILLNEKDPVRRMNYLLNLLRPLNIDIDSDAARSIANNEEDLKEFVKNFSVIVEDLRDVYNYLVRKSGREAAPYWLRITNPGPEEQLTQAYQNIFDLISKYSSDDVRAESKVLHCNRKGQNVTLHSDVAPSFMTDFFDRIDSYVKKNDKKGLKDWLTKRYLRCPYFAYKDGKLLKKGTILNKWIEELIKCCDENSEIPLYKSFASKFSWLRALGLDDKTFEDLSPKAHLHQMLTYFMAGDEITEGKNKYRMAYYPMFILGDANVAKYIYSKRYSKDEIVDGLYNVFLQEIGRIKLTNAFNKWLEEKGVEKGVESLDNNRRRWTLLKFLSDRKYNSIALAKGWSEEGVKNAISEYLDVAAQGFIEQAIANGWVEVEEEEVEKDGETRTVYNGFYMKDIGKSLKDFWMNAFFAQTQQMQLMTIDPAFYKSVKELQKRYKQVHSSGTPLNVNATDSEGNKYSETGKERVVYFNDIVVDMTHIQPEFMELVKQLFGENSDIHNKYKKCSLTDGQGYRTLKSYIAVLGMTGKLTPAMEQAYKEIMSLRTKKELTETDKARMRSLAVVFQPLKPFVFTHERITINSGDGQADNGDEMLNPVQLKYAETVLIPELLPEGSKLRALAEWMERNKIDLACATTAVKVGPFGSADISQAKNAKALNAALGEAFVHTLDYADMRIQTNLPDHITSARKMGTQIMKLIMGRLNLKGDYSGYLDGGMVNLGNGQVALNGRNLLALYNSLLTANILESWNAFSRTIGSKRALSKALVQNVISNSRNVIDDIMAFSFDEKTGDFSIPLFDGVSEHDAAALIFSLFRKMVNKQSVFGGSLVQVSAMGIRGFEEDKSLKYEIKDGNILWAECEMPFDLSYVDEKGNRVQLDYDKYVDKNGELIRDKNGEILLDKDYPHIREIVAYRMPTERECSMLNLKAVRYTRKMAGGTIKVPAATTVTSGWDFDADKLFFMAREFRQVKDKVTEAVSFDEYDTKKPPLENSKTARNNMLFNIIWNRLADKETLRSRLTPSAYPQASHAARAMREAEFTDREVSVKDGRLSYDESAEDPEPDYPVCDPMTIVMFNKQNQIADKLIGMAANQHSNHAISHLMDVFFVKSDKVFTLTGKRFFDFIRSPEGRDATMNLAEIMTSSVDAIKDPVLNDLNINEDTAKAAFVMLRLGYNADEVSALLKQPIIRELCDICSNDDRSVTIAIKDLKIKYRVKEGMAKADALSLET